MTEALKGRPYPTAIGSVPYQDAAVACEKILKNFTDIPFWPQLVRRSFLENMYVQFSGKFPGIVVDSRERRVWVDTAAKALSGEIEKLYEKFLSGDVGYFAIEREYAAGLYAMVEAIQKSKRKPLFVKGHITGPVSFGLTVTDEKKRALLHNTELKEALLKTLAMRGRWQVRKLREAGAPVIIFIDEPYLASMGSSYISLNKAEALSALSEVGAAIHREGALCGMHCCGNTDWGFLLGADIDILSFDAYNFYETLSLYPQELKAFYARGGVIAWGVVPNTEAIFKENDNALLERMRKAVALLADKGIPKETVARAMMVTPSCGLGLVDERLADEVIGRTVSFAQKITAALL